MVRIVVRIQH